MTHEDRRDLFELFEERYQSHSIMLVSQLPIGDWHKAGGAPAMADAVLDRLLHNAHKIEIEGESFRKKTGVKEAQAAHRRYRSGEVMNTMAPPLQNNADTRR